MNQEMSLPSLTPLERVAHCPFCGGSMVQKAGVSYTLVEVKQRWRCRDCMKRWTQSGDSLVDIVLQCSVSTVQGQEYVKYQIVIPLASIALLGWDKGDRLQGRISSTGFTIQKLRGRAVTGRGHPIFPYEQFKDAVVHVLRESAKSGKEGLTWSEIQARTGLPMRTPSPIWTRRLEVEKAVRRVKTELGMRWFSYCDLR